MTKQFSITAPDDLYVALCERAERDRRSVSRTVVLLLEGALAERGEQEGAPERIRDAYLALPDDFIVSDVPTGGGIRVKGVSEPRVEEPNTEPARRGGFRGSPGVDAGSLTSYKRDVKFRGPDPKPGKK